MKVPLSDAKANLSALVARVEAGESIGITRRGKTVATLTPYFESPKSPHCPTPGCLLGPLHSGPCQIGPLPSEVVPRPASAPGLTLADLLKASRE